LLLVGRGASDQPMLYAILCYAPEAITINGNREAEAAMMARLGTVQAELTKQGRLGPTARLMPTTTATSLRKGKEAVILDGPFAETKEQLLGFYVVECASLEAALDVGKSLGHAIGSPGTYEIRPIMTFNPGHLAP
jgi:hypothetical protein